MENTPIPQPERKRPTYRRLLVTEYLDVLDFMEGRDSPPAWHSLAMQSGAQDQP